MPRHGPLRPRLAPAPLEHGGDMGAARRRFPNAPEPFLDLSTGINPTPYPLNALSPACFTRLPEPDGMAELAEAAMRRYGAPSPAHVVCAPGTQILLPAVARLVPPGRAAVLSPTYAEHARAAELAGHAVAEVPSFAELHGCDLAVAVNPNNPDGRLVPRIRLIDLGAALARRGGLLLVDEAFMDVATLSESVAADVDRGAIVVLRSFGKFHGLPGIRLGFAIASPGTAAALRAALGPWAVSGPALAIGKAALCDDAWARQMRSDLAYAAVRLDGMLEDAGLEVLGGTALFRLARSDYALRWYERLGQCGILVRCFPDRPALLRFGLPRDDAGFQRLGAALAIGPVD